MIKYSVLAVALSAALLLVLGLVGTSLQRSLSPHWTEAYLGQTTVQVLSRPDSIKAFRLDEQSDSAVLLPGQRGVLGFPVTGRAEISKAEGARLAQLLLDWRTYASSYAFYDEGTCLFHPAIAFVFARGTHKVATAFCFSCNRFVVEGEGSKGAMVRVADGFKGAQRNALIAIGARVFPKDELFQALNVSRQSGQ